jgi:hypothetical protein
MPVKPYIKTKLVADKGTKSLVGLNAAALLKVTPRGTIDRNRSFVFLLNPETYTETKKSNWIPTQVPGQSDPVWQWMSGGERTITFDALITKESSDFDIENGVRDFQERNAGGEILNAFGSIAGSLFGAFRSTTFHTTIETCTDEDPGCFADDPFEISKKTHLNISSHLNYYRSLLYPEYDNINNPRKLKRSPPLLAFFNGSSFNKIPYGNRIGPGTDVYVLTDLKINITKQLPNLDPMEALVSFTLVQYNITSFSGGRWNNK